jgi:hypothetical protein
MNTHRTCIICLPRSGSQLCEKLVAQVTFTHWHLGEYFENWNQSEYVLAVNNKLYLKKFNQQPSGLMIRENYKEYISLLKKADSTQSLVLRLFLIDYYDKDILIEIITDLKNLGFEFLALHRDIKDQLISYMIALTYKMSKNKDVFSINRIIDEPVNIDLDSLSVILDILVTSSKNWGNNLSTVLKNVEYKNIKYENIYQDIENHFNSKITYKGLKSIKGDPLDLILNKKEVIDYLSSRGIS